MARINKTKVNYGKLSQVIQKLDKKRSIKVGILGSDGSQPISDDLDMAGLGAVHEFGTTINVTPKMRAFLHHIGVHLRKDTTQVEIPSRSFLRDSLLTAEGKKALQIWNVEEKQALMDYLNGDTVSADALAIAIGAKGVERVSNAFKTSGFGEWAPDSQITINRKGSAKPLIDNGDLARKISYEVKEL